MSTQNKQVANESCETSAVAPKRRMGWQRWGAGIFLLMAIGWWVVPVFFQDSASRLEAAAQQIQIGSDWQQVCNENKDLWGNWIFCSSLGPNSADEYFYGGATSKYFTELGWSLPDFRLINRFSGNLHIRSQCPVSIVVDQNGSGKVVGVRVRETWRGQTLSSAANIAVSK